MNKIWKYGIVGGLAGIPLVILGWVILIIGMHSFGISSRSFAIVSLMYMLLPTVGFLLAGTLSGIMAYPHLKRARESFLPGLIAGLTIAGIPLVLVLAEWTLVSLSLMSDILFGAYGASRLYLALISFIIIEIGMASLSSTISALVIFFIHEFGRDAPEPGPEMDTESLKVLYDELWKDARTMIMDMNRSIIVYCISGLFILLSGIIIGGFAVSGWQRIFESDPGSYTGFDLFIVIIETICSTVQLIIGPFLLFWYLKLKRRYTNLARMETAAGD
jgi:hypothetical protein